MRLEMMGDPLSSAQGGSGQTAATYLHRSNALSCRVVCASCARREMNARAGDMGRRILEGPNLDTI